MLEVAGRETERLPEETAEEPETEREALDEERDTLEPEATRAVVGWVLEAARVVLLPVRLVMPAARLAGRETEVAAVRMARVLPAAREELPTARLALAERVPAGSAASREERGTEVAPPATRLREEWMAFVMPLRPAP